MKSWSLLLKIYFITLGVLTLLHMGLPEVFILPAFLVRSPAAAATFFLGVPSLFFYSLLLLPVYWTRKASMPWRAVVSVASVGSVALVALGGGYFVRGQTLAAEEVLLAEDYHQPAPATIRSVAYYESRRVARCEGLCQKLLFGHEVQRFTAYKLPRGTSYSDGVTLKARTYWLERRDVCPDTGGEPRLAPAVLARLGVGECLIIADGVVGEPDVTIILRRQNVVTGAYLGNGIQRTARLTIREAGSERKELFRETEVHSMRPIIPLLFVFKSSRSNRRKQSWDVLRTYRAIGKFHLETTLKDYLGFRIDEIAPPSNAQVLRHLLKVLDTANTGSEPLSGRDRVMLEQLRKRFEFGTPLELARAKEQLTAALVRKSIAWLGNETAIKSGWSVDFREPLKSTIWALGWATPSDFAAFSVAIRATARKIMVRGPSHKGKFSFGEQMVLKSNVRTLTKKLTLSKDDMHQIQSLIAAGQSVETLIKTLAPVHPNLLPALLDALDVERRPLKQDYMRVLGFFSKEALLLEAARLRIIAARGFDHVHPDVGARFLARLAGLGEVMLRPLLKNAKSSSPFTRASAYLAICRLPPEVALAAGDLLLEALSSDDPKYRIAGQTLNATKALVRMGKKKDALRILSGNRTRYLIARNREFIMSLEQGFDRQHCKPKFYPYPDT